MAPAWQLTSPPFTINMELAAATLSNMLPQLFRNQSERQRELVSICCISTEQCLQSVLENSQFVS